MQRRIFVAGGMALMAGAHSLAAAADDVAEGEPAGVKVPTEVIRKRPQQDPKVVFAFVRAGHNDLAKVKQMLAEDPRLALASWDWGGGDWETALGGASHLGRREIAEYLLSQGARIDAFCAAMLGKRTAIEALLDTSPDIAAVKGPHGFTLLYHAAISGDVDIAEAIKPHLPSSAPDYNQALSAAARAGHLAMTSWLLQSGVTDPSVPDAFKKTPLATAKENGFAEVAAELQKHGAR